MPRTWTRKRPRNLERLTPEERREIDKRHKLLQNNCALVENHFPGEALRSHRARYEVAVYDALLCHLPAWRKAFPQAANRRDAQGLLAALRYNPRARRANGRGNGKTPPRR